jgi:hypothetical protein
MTYSRVTDSAIKAILAAGITIGAMYATKACNEPKQAIVSKVDLNQDGVLDLIIEKETGYKVPMYGVKEGDSIRYVTAKEMMKLHPDSLIDYKIIESRLNKYKL